jgi:hypothetical protein
MNFRKECCLRFSLRAKRLEPFRRTVTAVDARWSTVKELTRRSAGGVLLNVAVRMEDAEGRRSEIREDVLRPKVCAATKYALPIFGHSNEEQFGRLIQRAVKFSVSPASLLQ